MNTLHFCTVFDKKYLLKGLCLHYSLHMELVTKVGVERPFLLHVLCLDKETFETLKALNYQHIRLYQLWALEAVSATLRAAKELPPSKYGSKEDNYIWRTTPYFINHLLSGTVLEPSQMLMYVDSDIFFYRSPEIILNAIRHTGKSMGIHTHRFGWPFQNTMDVGWFNVGVVIFKNDPTGKRIANWWRQLTITNNHARYAEYGTCGDQKYFDLIYSVEKENICVFDQEMNIEHAAPWTGWVEESQMVFYHFSHFKEDLISGAWKDSYHGEWHPTANEKIAPYYERYNILHQNLAAQLQKI